MFGIGLLHCLGYISPSPLPFIQVADTLLLVHHAGTGVDSLGQVCLDACCSQGLPATLHVIHVSPDSLYDFYMPNIHSWNLLTRPLKYACDLLGCYVMSYCGGLFST